jgi:hypothetical protein
MMGKEFNLVKSPGPCLSWILWEKEKKKVKYCS